MRSFVISAVLVVLLFSACTATSTTGAIHRSDALAGRMLMKSRTDSFYHRSNTTRAVRFPVVTHGLHTNVFHAESSDRC
ncbi:MAG: hypothetical protein U0936_20055 [Planctomycetaceae bacterium]